MLFILIRQCVTVNISSTFTFKHCDYAKCSNGSQQIVTVQSLN